jgi:glutaredoxin
MFKVYSKENCPKCVEVKEWFDLNNISYETVDVLSVEGARDKLVNGGFRTVPQVFDKEGAHFGDCDTTIRKLKEAV